MPLGQISTHSVFLKIGLALGSLFGKIESLLFSSKPEDDFSLFAENTVEFLKVYDSRRSDLLGLGLPYLVKVADSKAGTQFFSSTQQEYGLEEATEATFSSNNPRT